jgi:hypothetical protein
MPSSLPNRPDGRRPADRSGVSSGWLVALLLGVAGLVVVGSAAAVASQNRRDLAVSARRYTYQIGESEDPVIRVRQNDLVRLTFSAEDIPHSFTIDEYRIGRRAEPGKPVTFEFRADREGRFEIYCNLTIDDRCLRELRGWLVVEPSAPEDAGRR